jgi:hypothetical protein
VTVPELLAVAESAGLTVAVVHGQLLVKGPKRAAHVGRLVLARKAEVFAHLVRPPPVWDRAEAVRRMHAADAVVEACGCVGLDPHVVGKCWRVFDAYRTRDMAALVRGCEEVEAAARGAATPAAA